MKRVYILLFGLVLLTTACDNDLDQVPPNIARSNSLKDFQGVLNAAYYYQIGSVTPMAVMGDFRADNAKMFESPYTEFDIYGPNLTAMDNQFFRPFYAAMYKAILSTNNVIENSSNATHVAEAKFLRALSYFKLVRVFGDVVVFTGTTPNIPDIPTYDLKRRPVADVYNNVIIPDLMAARDALSATRSSTGRATKYAAQGLLGKVYMQMGNFTLATPELAAVVNAAAAMGSSSTTQFHLRPTYAGVFGSTNDLNSEILFATQISSSIIDEYGFTEFWSWYLGQDTKSQSPVDPRLVSAYDNGDDRKSVNILQSGARIISPKYNQANGPNHDWIELRLADIILLYAEALNETTNASGLNSASILARLDPIRTRAGLTSLSGTALTQAAVRTAILNERRLELAFEGQRWFDLVRTGTVNAEMGVTIDSKYHLFPVPISEILATNGIITQNSGY
ncbi:RagB/SusD family nutrient uptake outer membrane protein [Flavobacterium sp. NG2]|uniref:RagB/SusD family nutrient uptake outer membrane protein n=1 Tax=Flavobacterium sp. NG2 TaxID=3097547 RepID=UPI002A7F7897|nr:RagB/SusD family nutrient uptake outer membrane protein [Flavobacterium sp. NG2]WPR72131.1 RagB/SusD family nutrient uptake outer membrane protein [Flavobacterium sp. NG2]